MSAHILTIVDALLRPFVRQPVTGRQASRDFGPPPAALYDLSGFTDDELVRHDRDTILTAARLQEEAHFRSQHMRAEVRA